MVRPRSDPDRTSKTLNLFLLWFVKRSEFKNHTFGSNVALPPLACRDVNAPSMTI